MEDILSRGVYNGSNGAGGSSGDINSINQSGSHLVEDLDSRWLRWKCLVCGYVYEGAVPVKVCPKCGNSDLDKFDDVE